MSYQHGHGYHGDPRYGQHQRPGNEEYVETPADGYNNGGNYQPSQGWTNGASYGYPPNGAQSHQGIHAVQSPNQQYDQPGHQQPAQYNPQSYAASAHQQPSQYNPQAYGASQYAHPQQSYNPAAYSNQYAQTQNYYGSQQSYNPGDYQSSSQYSNSSQPGGPYNESLPLSQGQHQSPQIGGDASRLSTQYTHAHSPLPPLPARTGSDARSSLSVYSTYSQPPPQRASSYNQSASQLPYPEYASSVAMPGFDQEPLEFERMTPARDELNLPSPPSYSALTDPSLLSSGDQSGRTSISPLPASEARAPPPPPAHASPRASPSVRHPQSRPLPGPPEPDIGPDYYRPMQRDSGEFDYSIRTQDELFDEVENAVMNAGSPSAFHGSSPGSRRGGGSNTNSPQPLFGSQRQRRGQMNGHSPSRSAGDSDAEALAGLEAMRMADEQEAKEDERRRQSGTGGLLGRGSRETDAFDSDNYATVDMGLYGGGYEANLSYGGDPNALAGARNSQVPSSNGSIRRPHIHGREMSFDSTKDIIQPFAAFPTQARVDSGGTGGLVDPNADLHERGADDGDNYSFTEETMEPSEPPDLFFHPDQSPALYRPLPPPPSSSNDSMTGADTPTTSAASVMGYSMNDASSLMNLNSQSDVAVPRFMSLHERSATPPVDHPTRSKTDAEHRLRKPGLRTSVEYARNSTYMLPATPAGNTMTLDLPSLPSKRFNASKLGASDFKKCDEPWSLSAINAWLRIVANPEQVTELKESMIREAVIALFTNKVPTMNITDAEVLGSRVIREMYDAGTLRPTEEWVRLAPGPMSGVIIQLTQGGCYSPTLHNHVMPGRCYSHHCQRTLKKVNLQTTPSRSGEDWATYYKLKKEDIEGVDKKEIERQNILHEIVQTEDLFIAQINVLQQVYRDTLATAEPSIIDSKRINPFLRDVFGKIDPVKKANEEHLLAQLKYRQDEQGPFIKGFSDIFRQWIRKAKNPYVEYAAAFPAASLLVRQELERNIAFRDFLDKARANKASARLGLDTYLKAPITRLQRYSLLLSTVHKNMKTESDERTNLDLAIDEIRKVTRECDDRVAEMQRKVDLSDLSQKLVLRPGMQQNVELNLNHLGRRLIHQGVLQRTGSSRFNWVDSHVLLFDHYMILAKPITVIQRGTGVKIEKYDVSRFPIPMDLLVLESYTDDAVRQSHYVRGLSTVSSVSKVPGSEPGRGRAGTTASPAPTIDRTNTSSSLNSLHSNPAASPAVTVPDSAKEGEKILYPFRIRHLGKEPYTLFAMSAQARTEWGLKIIEAKTQHAKSLYRQNAEPFRVRVMADAAFAYDSFSNLSGGAPIVIADTPMDRAIKEVELRFKDHGRPSPICRARVNCATSFFTPYPGKHVIAIGTDFGVYTSEIDNPRGWTKAIAMTKVTQIAVLEEFNVFLLISNGSLIAYHLDVVTTPASSGSSVAASESSSRRAPQKLSGTRDVGFFAVGRMKDRTLVFYKKRDGLSSTFKVLEPVFQKASERKRNIFKRGNTDFFRDFDEFYIPAECGGINLFSNSLSVSTSRGFEVLTLDKKQTFSVPDLRAPEVANIAQHIEGQATLGMLRLSEQEFLLCYEKCAVYVNKHGDVSRSVIMNFVGKARSAALYGAYLVLFDQDFVEVRNAQNGRLKQIIAGKDVRCLDDGGGGSLSGGSLNSAVANEAGGGGLGAAARTVKVAMAHPGSERVQVVVELVLNEGIKD